MSLSFEDMMRDAAEDSKPRPVKWRGKVIAYVHQISARDGLALMARMKQITGEDMEVACERTVLSLAAYCCDEQGVGITQEQAEKMLSGMTMPRVTAIVNAGMEVNALDDAGVENATKN